MCRVPVSPPKAILATLTTMKGSSEVTLASTSGVCLQANIDRQARKLEEVRAQPHAPGPQGKAAKQKKIDKLDKAIKSQMAKELGGVRMKQTFLVSCHPSCAFTRCITPADAGDADPDYLGLSCASRDASSRAATYH